MGGIASPSWPPVAASPSGTVGLPRLFFLVFYYDEMTVRRLFIYLFILGAVLSMVQPKFQCGIYWMMSCTSGRFLDLFSVNR
jgi:hypothetical protein